MQSHSLRFLSLLLATSALTACGNRDERPRDIAESATAPASTTTTAATQPAPAPVPAPSVCADLLTYSEVFTACGVAGSLKTDTHVFDGVPVCSFVLEPTDGPALVPVMHAVVRRYSSADVARTTDPLDNRGPKITAISGLGDAAIHYDSSDLKFAGETVAFRRGPLSGFVETLDHGCSRAGLEKVAAALLARMRDDAGAPRPPTS